MFFKYEKKEPVFVIPPVTQTQNESFGLNVGSYNSHMERPEDISVPLTEQTPVDKDTEILIEARQEGKYNTSIFREILKFLKGQIY